MRLILFLSAAFFAASRNRYVILSKWDGSQTHCQPSGSFGTGKQSIGSTKAAFLCGRDRSRSHKDLFLMRPLSRLSVGNGSLAKWEWLGTIYRVALDGSKIREKVF